MLPTRNSLPGKRHTQAESGKERKKIFYANRNDKKATVVILR